MQWYIIVSIAIQIQGLLSRPMPAGTDSDVGSALFDFDNTGIPNSSQGPPGKISDELEAQLSLFAQFSIAVYCPYFYTYPDWKCGARCEGRTLGTKVLAKVQPCPLTGAAGMVAINHNLKAIIVAYRGTVSVQGVVSDIQAWHEDLIHDDFQVPLVENSPVRVP
jgi:hypothetical protein